jgi:hypothetical protein
MVNIYNNSSFTDSPYGLKLQQTITATGTSSVNIPAGINRVYAIVIGGGGAGSSSATTQLIISILGAMPSGYVVGDVTRPSITSVGASTLLSADLSVSTYYTQTI